MAITRDRIDLLGQRVPRSLSREGRIRLLTEVAVALLQGQAPSREAAMFVGSALDSWLRSGGPFERHARIGTKRGSHRTIQAVFRRLMGDERKDSEEALHSGIDTDKDTEP